MHIDTIIKIYPRQYAFTRSGEKKQEKRERKREREREKRKMEIEKKDGDRDQERKGNEGKEMISHIFSFLF